MKQLFTHLRMVSFSGKDPLVRQLYEFDEQMEDLSQGVRPMSRALWKYRHHITVEELSSSFQREVLSGGGEEFKVLDAFLKQVTSTYPRKGLGFCATKIFFVILTPFSAFISGSICSWKTEESLLFKSIFTCFFLLNKYRNTSCVSFSFCPMLFVSSVYWWTDSTEELTEQMLRIIPSVNFSRTFRKVLNELQTSIQYSQCHENCSMQKVDVLSCFSNS